MNLLAVAVGLAVFIEEGGAWWISGDLDCQVTEWTAWSEPFGFGQISRERRILRWATGTGTPCPTELQQVKYTGKLSKIHMTSKI